MAVNERDLPAMLGFNGGYDELRRPVELRCACGFRTPWIGRMDAHMKAWHAPGLCTREMLLDVTREWREEQLLWDRARLMVYFSERPMDYGTYKEMFNGGITA